MSGDQWRRLGAVGVVVVAAVVAVILWAERAPEPPPAAAATSAPAVTSSLSPTDLAYLQLMISLDDSALPLLDILAADPAQAAMARIAADGHRAELVELRAALGAGGGVEDSSIHAGHDLPGMVVDADLAAVRAVPAEQRTAKALEVLREHLTGTTALCTSEGKAGADPATKAAAARILDAHGKLLAALPAM
ncbi:DUF305 domain-containing protein [Dactylosporangium sp. AC04546]|uniref:DUF305 domain-containing protein n=1 Tax=Dactylosporangium sp. AC04546 TaxID=2862460 RepID=UPI001EDEBD72|nr:DUF305 domain-containing protein [Dactylosporangium sp. AC04546]WVK79799.1 DUF305 domain-containing protein [Dactylosporangium sp. AC04546]